MNRFYRYFMALPFIEEIHSKVNTNFHIVDMCHAHSDDYQGRLFVVACRNSSTRTMAVAMGYVPTESGRHWYWVIQQCWAAGIVIDMALFTDRGPIRKMILYIYERHGIEVYYKICIAHLLRNVNHKFKLGGTSSDVYIHVRNAIWAIHNSKTLADYIQRIHSLCRNLHQELHMPLGKASELCIYLLRVSPTLWCQFANCKDYDEAAMEDETNELFIFLALDVIKQEDDDSDDPSLKGRDHLDPEVMEERLGRVRERWGVRTRMDRLWPPTKPRPLHHNATTNTAECWMNIMKKVREVSPDRGILCMIQAMNNAVDQCRDNTSPLYTNYLRTREYSPQGLSNLVSQHYGPESKNIKQDMPRIQGDRPHFTSIPSYGPVEDCRVVIFEMRNTVPQGTQAGKTWKIRIICKANSIIGHECDEHRLKNEMAECFCPCFNQAVKRMIEDRILLVEGVPPKPSGSYREDSMEVKTKIYKARKELLKTFAPPSYFLPENESELHNRYDKLKILVPTMTQEEGLWVAPSPELMATSVEQPYREEAAGDVSMEPPPLFKAGKPQKKRLPSRGEAGILPSSPKRKSSKKAEGPGRYQNDSSFTARSKRFGPRLANRLSEPIAKLQLAEENGDDDATNEANYEIAEQLAGPRKIYQCLKCNAPCDHYRNACPNVAAGTPPVEDPSNLEPGQYVFRQVSRPELKKQLLLKDDNIKDLEDFPCAPPHEMEKDSDWNMWEEQDDDGTKMFSDPKEVVGNIEDFASAENLNRTFSNGHRPNPDDVLNGSSYLQLLGPYGQSREERFEIFMNTRIGDVLERLQPLQFQTPHVCWHINNHQCSENEPLNDDDEDDDDDDDVVVSYPDPSQEVEGLFCDDRSQPAVDQSGKFILQ
jgi:hypothetical protein